MITYLCAYTYIYLQVYTYIKLHYICVYTYIFVGVHVFLRSYVSMGCVHVQYTYLCTVAN